MPITPTRIAGQRESGGTPDVAAGGFTARKYCRIARTTHAAAANQKKTRTAIVSMNNPTAAQPIAPSTKLKNSNNLPVFLTAAAFCPRFVLCGSIA